MDPAHLILSIWAITQHYADFEAQLQVLLPDPQTAWDGAESHVAFMFRKLLTP
jgi:TetR/AcrR family transcriptional regulator